MIAGADSAVRDQYAAPWGRVSETSRQSNLEGRSSESPRRVARPQPPPSPATPDLNSIVVSGARVDSRGGAVRSVDGVDSADEESLPGAINPQQERQPQSRPRSDQSTKGRCAICLDKSANQLIMPYVPLLAVPKLYYCQSLQCFLHSQRSSTG